ncbi:MAG: putative glycolipid-binding domain-containing protein [Candidatus Sulfotelmatobacter sp.]
MLQMPDDLTRAVVWKNFLIDGRDYCGLWHTAEGWLLKGTVVGVLKDQRPMVANYEIHCDENWLTHRVQVERTLGDDVKTVSLSVESRGLWLSSGQELRSIQGCDDVDLAVTPATNTLPIRRLNLQVGSSESIIAAWVKFPELTVQPLSQRYTRLAKDTYRYESNAGFSAEIVVDDVGLVIAYAGGWERIAAL